jgi:protein ImuA
MSNVKTEGFKKYNHMIDSKRNEYELSRLRHEIAVVDGHDKLVRLPLGIDSLDCALSGGLALGRVHILSGAMQTHGAVSGFTIALLCMLQHHLSSKKPANNNQFSNHSNQDTDLIMWCPASQRGGAGMLYGHGLAAAGLDPARLLIVDMPSPSRRLAALDDILRTKGLTAVVIEYDGLQKSADYWMRLARRAQLAAEQSGTTALLLGSPIVSSGFETAWQIKPAPNFAMQSNPALVRRSVWDLTLHRARGGYPHICRVSWQVDSTSLRAIDQTSIPPDIPVQADLNIHTLAT